MPTELSFATEISPLHEADSLHVVGHPDTLKTKRVLDVLPESARGLWDVLVQGEPPDAGRTATTLLPGSKKRLVAGLLPKNPSRHNSPMSAYAWPGLLAQHRTRNAAVIAVIDDASHARAAVAAIARTLPLYSARSSRQDGTLVAMILGPDGPIQDPALPVVADAVRRAAWMVDLPPNQLGPDAFVQSARSVAKRDGVSVHVLRRRQLAEQGMGGLVGVGRAANQEPALVVLDWAPEGAKKAFAWVGKGITYDTGGLSLKSKTGMPGMKTDMGGAAAVLAAFDAAVRLNTPHRLTAVLCIAENAIGPDALRPDDVIKMYSGRSVEVNNTDAEGRLVLADGVAWVTRHRQPELLVDMATLTGAQATATGKLHAAIYCNDEAVEQRAVAIGRTTGDLVHPLPFAPELFRKEFASAIADMKNSVKDRANAQSSCAGQFVGNHLGKYDKAWLHVDMAGPGRGPGGRGSGYGVNLLLGLLG